MQKQIQLSIPVPCHENWEKMLPVVKGRYCNACSKQVVDFSTMSDRELVAYFQRTTTGSTCGRFQPDQLQRIVKAPPRPVRWAKYFWGAIVSLFIAGTRTNCQPPLKGKVAVCDNRNSHPGVISSRSTPALPIKGRVIDENDQPVPFADVRWKGMAVGTRSDSSGKFTIELDHPGQNLTLAVSAMGYSFFEIEIAADPSTDNLIILKRLKEVMLTGEVVVTQGPRRKPSIMDSVSLVKWIQGDSSPAFFSIYPNPVPSGGSIRIEWKQPQAVRYRVELLNAEGSQVLNNSLQLNEENRTSMIRLPFVSAGVYYLRITALDSGRIRSEALLIE